MINWKPIETADKSGKSIISTNGKTIAEIYWVIRPAYTWHGINVPHREYWGLVETADLEGIAKYNPTHWDYMPELPKDGQ